jgi:type II secretory pathway component GspD/PulD (secretin)
VDFWSKRVRVLARALADALVSCFVFLPVSESRRQLAIKTDLEKRKHFVKLARVNRNGKFNRQERFEKRIIPANLELAERLARANGMLRSVANQVFRLRLVSPLSMLNHLNPSQKNSHLFNAEESSSLFH